MNIGIFALTDAYFNPTLAGGFTGRNFAVWVVDYLVFAGKMMSIFSMLFCAGLVLLTDRAEARSQAGEAFLSAGGGSARLRPATRLFALGWRHPLQLRRSVGWSLTFSASGRRLP